ncbi:MAG: penicillin-binding protein 2 [Atopobiaceae bacterium]|nr:penicillin-binding protein 2 [Atopobiaceae bacterium]
MRADNDHTRGRRGERSEASYEGGSYASRISDDRLGKLFAVFSFLLLVVAVFLVRYQVVEAATLKEKAQERRSDAVALTAKRGTIYDRNGNVLAMSEECKTIQCNPKEIKEPYLTAEVLVEHLGGESADYIDALTADGTFAYVKRKVDIEAADAVRDELAEKGLPGISFIPDSRRVYPYGAVGGQVLGIVGIDGDGLSGLELYYNDILRGTDGKMIIETGNYGTPIAGEYATIDEAVDGTDIVVSLDINVQRVAEENIVEGVKEYKADSGSVMVTDPTTGEILAACSTPLLDASDLSVVEEGATSLKLVSDSYEPGSIFKVLTSAIGIEQGVVTSSSTFYVPAYLQVGDDMVSDDDDREEDMYMSLREILRRSSNAGAALVAQEEIGADAFAEGIASFGIGQLTGIDYPGEVEGIVRAREDYDGSSLGSMSFGQGLAIPLVQMVKAVGTVADHGVAHTPHFLVSKGTETVEWPEGERVVSENTSRQVVDMMRTVVEEGTGENAQVPGYDVAGKTGTGELADATRGGYVEDKFTSSLIGFAPASEPSVLVYVGLNGTPYLAYASAAPVFSSIMSEALTDRGVLPAL